MMRTSLCANALIAAIALCLAADSAGAQVGIQGTYSWWTFQNPPAAGFITAESRISPSNVPAAGPGQVPPWLYYSWYFTLVDGDGAYIGIQKDPQVPPANKKAIFSMWGATAAICSPVEGAICQPFTGEGEGYQTLIPYNWVAGHRYRVRVRQISTGSAGDWWAGQIKDETTGVTTLIGKIRVPPVYRRINSWSVHFVEWYGPRPDTCGELPESTVYVFRPRAGNGTYATGPDNTFGTGECPSTIKNYRGNWARHHNGGRPRAFADVPLNHWAWLWIEELYATGVTSGCGTNPRTYCPSSELSRQALATYLLKARFGKNYTPPPATGLFADVPVSSPFAPWIEDLVNRGIAAGCDASPPRFCPTQAVTRQQMAVLLLRARFGGGYTPPPATGQFVDVPVSSPFARWIEDFANRGITSGCDASPPRFCPGLAALRAQTAVYLVEAFGLRVP